MAVSCYTSAAYDVKAVAFIESRANFALGDPCL